MRGSTWSLVKPILKVLQEHFASSIHAAFIIKPDNFWQKQRTSLGSQKYKFEVRRPKLNSIGYLKLNCAIWVKGYASVSVALKGYIQTIASKKRRISVFRLFQNSGKKFGERDSVAN